MKRFSVMFRALVALLIVSACDNDPLAPLSGDQYVLRSIAGVSLPAPYAPNPDHNERIVADTLAFQSNGSGMRRTVYEGNPDPAARRLEESTFNWIGQGDRVEITFTCPPDALCIQGPHLAGTRSNSEIVITESAISRHPLVFARRFPPD